ncbi:hypothetical protein ACTFIU_006707 [Dictyostelium citrinum]
MKTSSTKIKSILLKLIQILFFTISISIYIDLVSNKNSNNSNNSSNNNTINNQNVGEELLNKQYQIYSWFGGIILFSIAWSIGTFKWLSRVFLSFFIIKSIQQLIQHLPIEFYDKLRELIVVGIFSKLDFTSTGIINESLPILYDKFLPSLSPFSIEIIGIQCCLIIFFSTLGFNIYLADKFWLIKTIIVDWIISAILLIIFSITDLLKKQSNVYSVISYIFGSNILGFGTIKIQEYLWNLSSKYDDKLNSTTTTKTIIKTTKLNNNNNSNNNNNNNNHNNNENNNNKQDDNIIYDTDSSFNANNEQSSSTLVNNNNNNKNNDNNNSTISKYITEKIMIEENGEIKEQEVQVDKLDYSKLNEDQLNAILSEPILETQITTRNVSYHKSTRFINNLIAPENINSRISAKEFVGVIILWVYTISNFIITDYSLLTIPNILVVVGFSGTILTYLSTISAKRLTNKNPSKREC